MMKVRSPHWAVLPIAALFDKVNSMPDNKTTEKRNLPKPLYLAVAIALVAVLAVGAYMYMANASTPIVANGDTVKVYYTGSFTNGTVFDSNVGNQPLQFTVGANQLITGFNDAVIGMSLNQTKNVTLQPSEAYGYASPGLIVTVPRSAFGNQTISIGMPVSESSGGQTFHGIVTAANATNAIIDFNPPLAGKTLLFSIKVVGIQKKQ